MILAIYPLLFILIVLHGPDGREIDVNIEEITSMRCRIPQVENRLFTEGANAVIYLTDGRLVSVKETCNEVRARIEEKKP